MTFLQPGVGIAHRFPRAGVPKHDSAAAILPLWNRPLETAVRERMVLGTDGQSLVGGIDAGALGNGPTEQYAVEFEAEIVVETRSIVLLDEVRKLTLPGPDAAWRWFRCLFEIAFTAVLFKCHFGVFPHRTVA